MVAESFYLRLQLCIGLMQVGTVQSQVLGVLSECEDVVFPLANLGVNVGHCRCQLVVLP